MLELAENTFQFHFGTIKTPVRKSKNIFGFERFTNLNKPF